MVNKCKDIKLKAVCLLDTNPECYWVPGDPNAGGENEMPKFNKILPSKYQYLIIIDEKNKVLNEDFKYKSPAL